MFQGSCVALVTPMAENGQIDVASLKGLVEWHISQGTKAIVALGTTGESSTLTQDESQKVLEVVIETAQGRIPIIAGTGTNSTEISISRTQQAEKLGVDGCLVVTPYYNRPMQHGLLAHYQALARETRLPIILYNVPKRTGCDLLPETVAKLSTVPNIIGIKEATGDLSRLEPLKKLCQKGFLFYSGEDGNALDFILQGGQGVISVTANVAPKLMAQMCDFALSGREDKVREINNRLEPLHKHLFCETNPIPTKWALGSLGRIPFGIRLPLTPLSSQYHASLQDLLKAVGV